MPHFLIYRGKAGSVFYCDKCGIFQNKKEIEFMFNNIGGKIKLLAKITFISGSILSFITFIALLSIEAEILWPFAILSLFFGPVLFWIDSWFVYGFGEVIENTANVSNESRNIFSVLNSMSSKNKIPQDKRLEKLNGLLQKGLISEEEYIRALQNNEV